MRILVTGATGFIGRNVVDYLCENTKNEIFVLTRDLNNVKDKLWCSRVTILIGDIGVQIPNWFDYLQKPDIVLHLAWSKLPNYTESFHLTENLPNDIKFLENLIMNGLKSLVVLGTCFEYGLQEGELSENLPTFPSNPYSIAKDTLRRYLEVITKKYNLNFKWLRLFYTFGEDQNSNSIISQLKKAINNGESEFRMSGGEQFRDYLHVTKVSEIICNLALDLNSQGVFNVCSGKPIKLKDFIISYLENNKLRINLLLGFFPYSSLEPMNFWGNCQKLKKFYERNL